MKKISFCRVLDSTVHLHYKLTNQQHRATIQAIRAQSIKTAKEEFYSTIYVDTDV